MQHDWDGGLGVAVRGWSVVDLSPEMGAWSQGEWRLMTVEKEIVFKCRSCCGGDGCAPRWMRLGCWSGRGGLG